MPSDTVSISTTQATLRGEAGGRLCLTVIADEQVRPTSWRRRATSGSAGSDRCDIFIDDPAISRKHAVLHVTPRLTIEDAGA